MGNAYLFISDNFIGETCSMMTTHLAPDAQSPVLKRFASALRQAMAVHGYSERRLATEPGITIGTTQKYFRGKVPPMNVATAINRRLAALLGVTLDALIAYYETGEYDSRLTYDEVVSWVRSNAGAEHVAGMLEAMSQASRRACRQSEGETPSRYDWPLQELREAGISDSLRERMGLGDEEMEALATRGEYDDALVEAFSLAVNLEEEAVREAFRTRSPVG